GLRATHPGGHRVLTLHRLAHHRVVGPGPAPSGEHLDGQPTVGTRGAEREVDQVRGVADLLRVADLAVEAPVGRHEHRYRGHRLLEALAVDDLYPLETEVAGLGAAGGEGSEQQDEDQPGEVHGTSGATRRGSRSAGTRLASSATTARRPVS